MAILQPSFTQALSQLSSTPSVSSTMPELDMGNLTLIHLLANWLTEMGFSCEILPLPHAPNKANLIATLGNCSGGLVLAGYTDTVPYDDSFYID